MTPKPNLLFIMTDHQRGDSIGMEQAGVEVCSNLNRLAAEGTRFTRAYNTCPLCVPARTALATGKYPTKTGVVFNDWKGITAGDHKPVHQYLAEAGYEVGHIGVHHIKVKPELEHRTDFSTWVGRPEYDEFRKQAGNEGNPMDGSLFKDTVHVNQEGKTVERQYSNTRTDVWPLEPEYFYDLLLCREAVSFLRKKREKPFALFLYLWAPHPPLWVPEPYASMFAPDSLDLPGNVGMVSEGEPSNRRKGAAAQIAEGKSLEEWRRVWAAHLGLVNMADTGIGRVIDALDASGNRDNTMICFTVDHGDHLGQHLMYQKMEMYEQAVNIPLIFSGPGITSRSHDAVVSHLDVMPTILEYAGLNVPGDIDGDSLLESLKGNETPEKKTVFSQYSGNACKGDIRRAAITGQYKYVYDPDAEPELYDLNADPLEQKNIANLPECKSIQKQLHKECREWHLQHRDWVEYSG